MIEAADLIWECWNSGRTISMVPEQLIPETRREAYTIQSHYLSKTDYPGFGWKIAATSIAGQQHIGVTGPIAGRLLKERVFGSNSVLTFGSNRMAVAEPEFAFRMKKTLFSRTEKYSQKEVMSGVDTLHLAIEIPNSRLEDFSAVGDIQLIIDNACAHEFIIGSPINDNWLTLDLSKHHVDIYSQDGRCSTGKGSNVLGDPRIALTWLVNELSENGIDLIAGEVVTTGTCAPPLAIQKGDLITADFGSLGKIITTVR